MKSLGIPIVLLLGTCGVALWLLPCEGTADAQFGTTSAVRLDDQSAKERIESDLRLRVELKSPKIHQAGTIPGLTATLINTSKTAAHPVVKPGDGSEVGWREPYVYWTATLDRGDGQGNRT